MSIPNARLREQVETLAEACYGKATAITSDCSPSTGYFAIVWDRKGMMQLHTVRGEKTEAAALRRLRDILLTKQAEIEAGSDA